MISLSNDKLIYKNSQCKVYQKHTIVNALDVLDTEVSSCQQKEQELNKLSQVLPSAVLTGFLIVGIGQNRHSRPKQLPFMLGATALSTLFFSYFNKIHADRAYKATLLGEYNALDKMKNPKQFLELNEKRQEEINSNVLYKYYKNKHYENSHNIFVNYNISQHIDLIKSMNNIPKDSIQPSVASNNIANDISKIGKSAQNYTANVISGFSLLGAIGGVASIGITQLLTKYTSKMKFKSNASFEIIKALLLSIPLISLLIYASNNFQQNIEKVAKYKAKESYVNGIELKNSIWANTLDYCKTKNEYKQKVLQQEHTTVIKNNVLQNSDANDIEIEQAKKIQKSFFDSICSNEHKKTNKEVILKNSISKDLLVNSMLPPITLLFCKGLDNISRNKNKFNKPIATAYAILSTVFGGNALLTKYMNKN